MYYEDFKNEPERLKKLVVDYKPNPEFKAGVLLTETEYPEFPGCMLSLIHILQCGEPVYNLNENGIEELKTMHAVLELEGVKECLDDDFLLAIKTIFCSKFGFNMRNDIAHGLVADKQFNSYKVLYTWWFILKMCYMFCGKLQIDNRIKVNKKLEKLLRESEEQ